MKIYSIVLFTSLLVWTNKTWSQTDKTVGLIDSQNDAYSGYTLFAPMNQTHTYLIDIEGNLLHSWEAVRIPGHTVYLTEEGDLYRAGQFTEEPEKMIINGPGGGGIIEKYNWNSNLIWYYEYSDSLKRQHHDFKILPNGNVLILAWEAKTGEEAISMGRDPSGINEERNVIWPDHLIEVEPGDVSGGEIVWEWHVWDHLVQDFDSTKANYGSVSESPHLVDINFNVTTNPDWNHVNGIDYNPVRDEIILSARSFHEFWVIDHSTTIEEAKGHTGGNSGKGGDLLYRWGNNATYKKGDEDTRKLYGQHNVHWIPYNKPNGGKIMIFNNGQNRPDGSYTSIEILDPLSGESEYMLDESGVFLPLDPEYRYTAPEPEEFLAGRFSSAQQQANGNILICDGPLGHFFEINPNEEIVWDYFNPVTPDGVLEQGEDPFGKNSVFHVQRFDSTYAAFEGKNLVSQGPIEIYPKPPLAVKKPTVPDLSIYPNPANTQLAVSHTEDTYAVLVYDLGGNQVLALYNYNNQETINISELKSGMYIISIDHNFKRYFIKY